MPDNSITYAAAMEELEGIVARMEAGKIEVDELAASVQRASELISMCRGRLRDAGAEVEKALAALRDESTAPVPKLDAVAALPLGPAARPGPRTPALPSTLDDEDPFADTP